MTMNKNLRSNRILLLAGAILGIQILCLQTLMAQGLGISSSSTVTPNPASMLDISAGNVFNRGLLIPRVTYAQRTASGPNTFNPLPQAAQGLMVYQTDNTNPGEGIYFNTSTNTTPNWVKIGSTAWGLNGNSGTSAGTNFIGTTDVQDFAIRTGGAGAGFERMRILSGGNVGIGATAPAVKLAVGGNGVNVGSTDLWVENNLHVQGNEWVGGSPNRGRLRVGTAWNYVGLYAESNSPSNAGNDLVLGASSGVVRIGPGTTAHKLLLPASTSFQMIDNAGNLKIMLSDATGKGTWKPISDAMQIFTVSSTKVNVSSTVAYTDIPGLTCTVVTTSNSNIVINTTGSVESDGFSGTSTLGTISLQRTDLGTPLTEQAFDIHNNNGVSQVVQHWAITYTQSVTAGTYIYKVRAIKRSGENFDAGGADTTSLPSDGAMSIEVYPK